jgi:hypothetical protein
MHYKLLYITQANNKQEAIDNATDYMEEVIQGNNWADYFSIGGRWNGIIKGNASKITEKIYKEHLEKWEGIEYMGGITWYGDEATTEHVKDKDDENYYTRRTYRGEIPHIDRYIINTTFEPISKKHIGKHYIVIVDYHN